MAVHAPVYHLSLASGSPFSGFLIETEVPGWLILNHWSGELVLDGYFLLPADAVLKTVKGKRTGIHHRLQRAMGVEPQDPGLQGKTLKELLENIASKWPAVCIYRREHGLDELDVGLIRETSEDHLIYRDIAPNGDIDPQLVTVHYDEILKLTFGGAYESMLLKVIEHRRDC